MNRVLMKTLEATCPHCGASNDWIVDSYRHALRSAATHQYECHNCHTIFKSSKDELRCRVIQRAAMGMSA